MNLQELRTFLTIVDTGSLVRAAGVLNVTQSTVTARLQSLEETLGQKVLVRNKSGASMTAAGVKLHRYAETIVNLWQQARQETALPSGVSGVCNLACEYDLWPGLGEDFAEGLMAHFPDISLSIWLGSQADVKRWLDEGKSDLAFTYRATHNQQQSQRMLWADQLVLVSTEPDGPIKFDPTYVYVDGGPEFGREHAIAYADADTARISFGNASIAMEHIKRHGGSAYLPLRLVTEILACGEAFRRSDAPAFERRVFVTWDNSLVDAPDWLDQIVSQ